MKSLTNPKRAVANATLAIALLGSGFYAYRSTRSEAVQIAAGTATETATTGDVVATVSASGNFVSSTDLALQFQQSGRVKSILVKAGERVTAGQELATVEDAKQRSAVDAATSALRSAEAKAEKTISGLSSVERQQYLAQEQQSRAALNAAMVALQNAEQSAEANLPGLQAVVDQARRNVEVAQESFDAAVAKQKSDNDAAEVSVSNARQSLLNAEDNASRDNTTALANLTSATKNRDDAKQQLDVYISNLRTAQDRLDPNSASYPNSLLDLVGRYTDDQSLCKTSTPSDGVQCTNVAYLLQLAQTALKQESSLQQSQTTLDSSLLSVESTKARGAQSIFSAQTSLTTTVNNQKSIKTSGETTVSNARNALESAKEKQAEAVRNQTTSQLKDQQAIRTQRASVTNADRSLSSQRATNAVKLKPAERDQLASDRAQVASAENQLETAEKNLADTILRAPVDGVVASIDGSLGDDVGTGGSTKAFLTLTNPESVQVKVGFSEADALRLVVGQNAKVTLDSAEERVFTGTIASIDQTQTLVSNVVTYYAYVDIVGDTSGVRPGMSASVEVIVAERKGVLSLSTRAVKGSGKSATLRVQDSPADGTREATDRPAQVTIGLRGDARVEILSGLTEGSKVVLPNASGAGGSLGNFTPPAGFGGGLR